MPNVRRASMVLAAWLAHACSGTLLSDEPTVPPAPGDAPIPNVPPAPGLAPAVATPPPPVLAPAPPIAPAPTAQAIAGAPAPRPAVPESAAPTPPAFDAGSGMLQPDGKTVLFRIADGTGGKDWNRMDQPIRVKRGMTLRLVDDDTTKRHFLHTLGQPCTHAARAIGTGYDCAIQQNAPTGMINGVYDHNGDGGRGRLYIEVVQ